MITKLQRRGIRDIITNITNGNLKTGHWYHLGYNIKLVTTSWTYSTSKSIGVGHSFSILQKAHGLSLITIIKRALLSIFFEK